MISCASAWACSSEKWRGIPANADPKKQAEFLNDQLEPLLEEEKQGKHKVFFVNATHFAWGGFQSTRHRLNHRNQWYLHQLRHDCGITLQDQETTPLYPLLHPYLPNLNLIERLWKFTKKKCLNNRYHETFSHFKAAINECLEKVKSTFSDQVQLLLNTKFQLFKIS